MNLLKDFILIDESSSTYTDTEIDDILEIFAMPISPSSSFFQFDSILVKQFILSLKQNERSPALAVLFDYLDLLDVNYEESDLGTSLRQMVAISYFIPQFSKMNHYEFMDAIISTLTKMNQDLLTNKQFSKQYSASLSLVLSKLEKRICDINICNPNYFQYQKLLELSLQLYQNDEIVSERETPTVVPFFFNSLLSFRGNANFSPEQCQLILNLASFLSEKIKYAVKCKIDCMQFMHHIFSLLINNNPLSMYYKYKLVHVLANLTKLSGDVSKFLFNPTNSGFIVHFIILSLQSIKFEFPIEKIHDDTKSPDILTKKYQNIQSKISRTFDEDFPTYSEDERKAFSEKKANDPQIPLEINSHKDILYLIKSISLLCCIQEESKAKYHLQFMKDVIQNQPIMSLPISPFFISTWVVQFLRFDLGLVSDLLHKMNFYLIILENAFLKYDDQMLKNFIVDLIIYLTHKAHMRKPYYLSDLMIFALKQINRLNISQQIFDGLATAANISSSTFVNASLEVKFADQIAECLNELFYLHSTQKTEEIIETRTKLLKFIDRIDSYPRAFQYLFENQDLLMSILSHFYDRSTINFASRQLLFLFQQFSRKSNTMNTTIKFFESFDVDEQLIKILLNCSTSGYENNPYEIAKLFSETNFLDFLIDSSRKLNSDKFFFDLVELFSKMTTNKNYSVTFDAFLRLANLVPQNFDLSNLWEIVFEDDLNDSEPRKIKNVAPISLLFDLKIKSNEIEPFIKFLSKCIDIDPDINYALSYLDFPSQILSQLSEYRTKENGDEKFDLLFDMFYSLSLYSLKSQDFKSLFRLCASLPDHKRPFFTLKVINMMSELFTKRWNIPTSFFSLSGDNTHLQLPEVSIDVINTTGFHLSFDSYINTDDFEGKLFDFTSSSSKLSLEWNKDHFTFIVKTELMKEPKVIELKEQLKIKEWSTIEISYTPKSLKIFENIDLARNDKSESFECEINYDQIIFENDFSHYQALVNVPSKVCRVLCMKEPVNREFMRKYNLLPRSRPISFHISEKSTFYSYFSSIFGSNYENDILFMFYASVVSGKFAVSLVSPATLRVTGNVYNHEPEPSFILDLLGGISCLIPFFGQIDQGTINGQTFDKNFLPTLLDLLTSVFSTDETSLNQKDFRSIQGPSILAFLLSICSLKDLENDDVITAICKLFKSIRYVPLVIDFVDNILFNFKLWIYLPFDFQARIYMKFYDILFERITNSHLGHLYHEGINISKILMLMRIYLWNHNSNKKICLVDEPKIDILNKTIEGQRPSDCTSLRNIFWEIVKQMSEKYMTDEDVSLLISFCCETLDLQFSYEAISLFTYLIQISNPLVLDFMKRDYAFSPLFELLKLPNSVTQNRVIQIFLILDQQYLKPFPIEDWYNAILTTISYQTIDESFVKEIEKEMIKPIKESLTSREPAKYYLSNSRLIPLFLLSIQQLNEESTLTHFNLLCNVIQSGLKQNQQFLTQIDKNWDYPFLLLLMSQIPNPSDQPSKLSQKCIEFLIDIYIKSTSNSEEISEVSSQKLLTFSDFIYLMIHKSKHSYVHIIRLLYTQFLEVENIKIKPVTSISTYMFYKIYCKIFEYIIVLPKVDITNNEVEFNYQDLYKMSLEKKKHSPKFVYAVRHLEINEITDWVDVGIVKLLIKSLIDRDSIFKSLKHDEFEPSYILGSLLSAGLQLPKYLSDFLNLSDSFLQYALNSDNLKSYKNALIEVFSGLVEINESKKEETTNLLYTNTILFADILQHQFRITIPTNLTSSSEFDINLLNPLVEISNELDIRFQKMIKSLIMMKEMKIAKMARDCRGEVQITPLLKPGEMTYEVALRTQLEQFALTRKQLETTSIKNYKEIFDTLSSENGPWQTIEIEKETHRKLSQKINGFCRFFMKPNNNFEDHKIASIARDIGNLQDAIDIYQREYAKFKMPKFRGDLALVEADRKTLHHFSTQTDHVFLKLDCRWVTIKKNYSGTLSLLKNMLVFDSSEHFARIPLDTITKIFQRHYILLDTAIEIFTTMKKSFYFDFPDTEQRQLFIQMISEFKPINLKFIQVNYSDIKPLIQKAIEKWQRGEMTNFEYLLKLNKYAGRSYHDLSQYPVFPWVLQDYTSESLDFNNPQIYRDLTKPLGTYTSERLDNLKERIIGAKKFDPDSYYLYGALYSSSAVVIGYLIRLEPFTTLHITLQSQKFDFADRLFNDIPAAWESVTSSAMDFRELIPEFFYFPDFLVNENKFDLGKEVKTGALVDDVRLPKWAKSPQDFILKNRIALESKFVTAKLHHWIDLIFGPKSRGSLSELNDNLFHPYFYETSILGADEKRLKIICEFAACFGQAALQIFDGEPAKKQVLPSPFMNALLHIEPSITHICKSSISKIVTPTMKSLPLMISNLSSQRTNKTIISVIDSLFNFVLVDLNNPNSQINGELKMLVPSELEDICQLGQRVAICANSAVVTVPWDPALFYFRLDNLLQPTQPAVPNKDKKPDVVEKTHLIIKPTAIQRLHNVSITALAMNEDYIVSGSKDSTLRIWTHSKSETEEQGYELKPICAIAKHQSYISAISINQHLRVCYSISVDGFLMSTSLLNGSYMNGIQLQVIGDPVSIITSNFGDVVVAINGTVLESSIVSLDQNLRIISEHTFNSLILDMEVIPWCDGAQYIALAMRDGITRIHRLPFLDDTEMSIRASNYDPTTVTYNNYSKTLLIGDSEGKMHSYKFSGL